MTPTPTLSSSGPSTRIRPSSPSSGRSSAACRVRLVAPLEYGPFVTAMKRAAFILSDSGGVQEEAATLGTPVLVPRNVSERPEAIRCGVARLVGDDPDVIVREASRVLAEPRVDSVGPLATAFGDGHAAARIVSRLHRMLVVEAPEPVVA